jgi:hypothetical protein
MADKVPKVPQIDWREIVLKVLRRLVPARYRSRYRAEFPHTGKSPGQMIRLTLRSIGGFIGSQTTEDYYPGMAVVEVLTIVASLLGKLTPLSAGIVAGAVSGLLVIRDTYMDREKKGYARFLWDSVIAIALLIVFQGFIALRSSGHLRAAVPWIAAQSLAGGASASFFRLIFKMPPNPFDRALEDYKDILKLNIVWIVACEALMYTSVEAVPYGPLGFLSGAPFVVGAVLINLQSPRIGGALAPELTSLKIHPVQQEADHAKGTLALPAQTPAQRCLELGFFAVLLLPFAAALWIWWTKQSADVDWRQLRANAGALLILSIFWIRIRAVNAETVKALDKKVKEELKKLEKPPEKTDHDVSRPADR